jgi:TetR/AcrR family transcriptional regulator of autoinduction and epiphytic fitness
VAPLGSAVPQLRSLEGNPMSQVLDHPTSAPTLAPMPPITPTPTPTPAPVDGRWLRSVRTRAAIIDGWIDLVVEGDLSPTAKGVADRASIGLRTVFQHFTDMHALQIAACEEFVARLRPLAVEVPTDITLMERISMMASNRAMLFDACTPVRRACDRQSFVSAAIAQMVERWETVGSLDVFRVFEEELSRVPAGHRRAVRYGVDAMLSWGTWHSLRAHRGLDANEARIVVINGVAQMLMAFSEPRS